MLRVAVSFGTQKCTTDHEEHDVVTFVSRWTSGTSCSSWTKTRELEAPCVQLEDWKIGASIFSVKYRGTNTIINEIMNKINWGIIGCGDVTEAKKRPGI